MLEITEPAGRLIRDAWRKGRVLVVRRPWNDYRTVTTLIGTWHDVGDRRALSDTVRVGDGDWVFVRSDLLPEMRRRQIRLELHSILGFWRGIAVRDLDPAPAFVVDRTGLWPRLRTPRNRD